MANYRRGSKGSEVARIQERLREEGLYRGPVDGIFGGGTEAAVRSFQRRASLGVDGVVGTNTWARLFAGEEIPEPAIGRRSLARRSLALTGSFETGQPVPECFTGVTGDFDGQGLSFGALQWNLGQGSLQPLLEEMLDAHREVIAEVFDDRLEELEAVLAAKRAAQLDWARSVQDGRFRVAEPWRGLFKSLGRREEFQELQVKHADRMYRWALDQCRRLDLGSERAAALLFDIRVQNGSISTVVRAQIQGDFARLDPDLPPDRAEEERLCVVANRRAEASNPRWVEDVRRRKLTIARGEGVVHGLHYHLEEQYGIRLAPRGGRSRG